MSQTPAHRREQVRNGARPSEDRFISLRTHRLLASDVFVVAVIDGTGKLAEPTSLLTTTDFNRARRHANTLFWRWGGESAAPDYTDHLPGGRAPNSSTAVDSPIPTSRGCWVVRWQIKGEHTRRGKRFDIKAEAQRFHAQLTEELETS